MQNRHSPRDNFYLDGALWERGRNITTFIALAGLLASLAGFLMNRAQFYQSWLVSFAFLATVFLGGMFFLMVQFLTGSAWSIPVRRLMESIAASVPVLFLLFIPVAFGIHELYQWSHPEVVASEAVVRAKVAYLNPAAFTLRGFLFITLWSLWALSIYHYSTRQDSERSIAQMNACSRWSAPGLALVTITGTLASFDWIMSLDPKWYSTIFGLYCLSGGALAFFAILTLIAIGFNRSGLLAHTITEEHFHDLGKWMFAMTVFWAYIGVSQYLLIWYANLPEETIFYRNRVVGSWNWLSGVLLFGRFVLPFIVMIFRASKRNLAILQLAALWIAAMHFVDMYWLIMPTFSKQGIAVSWMDFAALVAVMGVAAFAFWWRLRRHALVPVGDLRFEQGMRFENI